ncbi:MAG: hypothetical protein Q9216_005981 [Gyalolechia sp. 2 TL-2023]
MEGHERLYDSEESEQLIDPEELGDSIKSILNPVPASPRPLWWDGEHSRYVKGGRSQSATDDLRPAPLNSGQKSFLEMLKEGPPDEAQCDATPSASSSANAIFTDPVSHNHSDPQNKEQQVSISKFASLRKLKLLPSTKNTNNDSHGRVDLKRLFSPSSRKVKSIPTTQDSDGGYELSTSYPATQASETATPARSPNTPQHPADTFSPSSSPGKIHGQPPASMTRPVIPHTVTGDHLNLTNYPPLSKDDLATLPKEIEPTLPACEQTFGLARRAPLRHCHSTPPISDPPQVLDRLADYPLPEPKRSRNGKIQKYDRNDPAARTLEILAHEEIYGRDSTIRKYAPPETVEVARREAATHIQHKSAFSDSSGSSLTAPVTPTSGHLTPSTPGFLEFYENLSRSSKGSSKSSHRGSNKVSSEQIASPKLPRINEDHTIFESPAEAHPRSSNHVLLSRNRDSTGVRPQPSRRLFAATSLIQGERTEGNALSEAQLNRQIPVANHTVTPAMANMERYFRRCTPESMHSARIGILSLSDRTRVSSELRSITKTEVVWHDDRNSIFPKHPNHHRNFKSRNLWCIQHRAKCALCKSACCVYVEAVEAFIYANSPYDKLIAKEAGELIKMCSLNQVEESTFLQCSECYRTMCPNCIGICPVEQCQLQTCKASSLTSLC